MTAALQRQAGPSSRILDELPLVHEELPQWIDEFLAHRRLSWQQLERGEIFGEGRPFDDLDEFQHYLICDDPVRWAECHLIEKPEDGGRFWRFFDYQKPALRWPRSLVLKCGAETGKSRHLIAKIAYRWDADVTTGSQLLAASQDGQLDLLYEDLRYYLEAHPRLRNQIDDAKTKVKPYRKLVNRNGNVLYLRPAAADGEAFRGIHVNLGAYYDEAAKADNPRIFLEFFRSVKPTLAEGPSSRPAPTDIVSVPDGRRDTEFFRLAEGATPVRWDPEHPEATDEQLQVLASAPNAVPCFNWRKPFMPPPFWSSERKQRYVQEWGGIDSPGYQQNVLGEDGDPSGSVFPWPIFARALQPSTDYRALRLLWDESAGVIHLDVYRVDPGYSPAGRASELDPEAGAAVSPILWIVRDEEIPLASFDLEQVLAHYLPPSDEPMVTGGDLGASDDPSEFLWYSVNGGRRRLVRRIQLKRFPYPVQRELITLAGALVDPRYGWGIDATGVGTAVEHEIRSQDPRTGANLSGFVMNASTLARSPETGEVLLDPDTGAERRVSYKELGTQLLEHAFQHTLLELPCDPDLMDQFPGHKARITDGGKRVFDKTHDHLVDASRVALLRAFLLEHGGLATVPVTFASVPRGATRGDHRAFGRGSGSARPVSLAAELAGGGRSAAAGGFARRRGGACRPTAALRGW